MAATNRLLVIFVILVGLLNLPWRARHPDGIPNVFLYQPCTSESSS